MTNGDFLRTLRDEELAFVISTRCMQVDAEICWPCEDCEKCWLDWLRQEYTLTFRIGGAHNDERR